MAAGEPLEIEEVSKREVACEGNGTLGHPRVFLNMGQSDHVDCPYCGRRFALRADGPPAPATEPPLP